MVASTLITAISVGLATYSAGAGFFASVAAGFGALGAFGSFLVSAALGFALNALAPKPKIRGANRGYQVNTRGSALDHQIIYGEARVGGVIVFEESVDNPVSGDLEIANNQFLHRVYVHAGHEIEGYKEVYIDGKKVTEWRRGDDDSQIKDSSGNVTSDLTKASPPIPNGTTLVPYTVCDVRTDGTVIGEAEVSGSCNNRYAFDYLKSGRRSNNMLLRFYDGTQTTADGSLINDSDGKWNTDCVLNNTAYMIATMGFLPDVFPNGVPEITCTIKGKKCFDPRNGTTAYSQNPAICIRDYLTNDYGLNEDVTNIDDDLVATAANVCDEIVEVGINRYVCKGAFATSVEPADILSDLLTSMGGLLWYSQGKWRMKPAYWTPPTLTLTEDDLRSSIAIKTRHSRRDNFNVVKGTFRGPPTNWQVTDYPEVPVPGSNPFLAVDGGQESVIDLDLPFTDNPLVARRIARIFLERNRQQLTISGSFGLRAFGLQIGDNVNLTLERFGWVEKTFEVNSWTFGLTDNNDLQVQMTLREISENVFDEVDDGVVFELDNTNLPDPFLTETPTNLTAFDSGFINTDGTFVNSIAVSWNVVKDPVVDYYVFEWKKSTATEYNSVDLATKNYEIPGVEDGVQYDIRVKSVNTVGVSSDYASITFTPVSDTTAPGLPTGLTADADLFFINLSWVNPADKDLNRIEIWEGPDATLANASLIATISGSSYNRGNLAPLTTRYYWIRAEDYSGNFSAFVGPVNATTRQITTTDIGDAVIPWDALDPTVESVIDSKIDTLEATVADEYATINEVSLIENDVDGLEAKYGVTIDVNGNITGYQLLNGTGGTAFNVRADQFAVFNSTGTGGDNPFTVFTSPRTIDGDVFPAGTYIKDAFIDRASIVDATVDTLKIKDNAVTVPAAQTLTNTITGNGSFQQVNSITHTLDQLGDLLIIWNGNLGYSAGATEVLWEIRVDGVQYATRGGTGAITVAPVVSRSSTFLGGTRTITAHVKTNSTVQVFDRTLVVIGTMK